MSYTLAQAAQASGVNRSTVLRAIKSGKISGQRDGQGAWTVEPVELHRVFPPAEAMPKAVPQHAQPDAQVDALVGELRAQLAEMRGQRDAWQAIGGAPAHLRRGETDRGDFDLLAKPPRGRKLIHAR